MSVMWGPEGSTDVQSLTDVLAQSASVALGDLHVATWTAKTPEELAAVVAVLHELHTKLLISFSTAEAMNAEFQRRGHRS
jgi:hypothetical protein